MRKWIVVAASCLVACGEPPRGGEVATVTSALSGAYRVKDIVAAIPAIPGGAAYPTDWVRVGNRIFFAHTTAPEGTELWVTDGTAAGTQLVIDINPGPTSSSPKELTAFKDGIAFTASFPGFGRELWFSDGTVAGTRVVEVSPGFMSGDPELLTAVGSTLFFRSYHGSSGSELWKSDGTQSGTKIVKDIAPGSASASPKALANVGGVLFFGASATDTGTELWKSDGSETGTVVVKDLVPGTGSSGPTEIFDFGGVAYFAAGDGSGGASGLYRSDGSESGTYRVVAGASPAFPRQFTVAGGKLFFHAATVTSTTNSTSYAYSVWVTDGTAEGTRVTKMIGTGVPTISFLTSHGGLLYFLWRGLDDPDGLWRTDGTEQGTVHVCDASDNLAAFDGGLVFGLYQTGVGEEPAFSNGTPGVAPVPLGNLASDTQWDIRSSMASAVLMPFDAQLLFFPASDVGIEPWRTDGTPAGTRVVKELSLAEESSNPQHLIAHGGALYFSASSARSLWTSDGTAAGTERVMIGTDSLRSVLGIASTGAFVLASADHGPYPSQSGPELYRVEGAQAALLADLYAGQAPGEPQQFLGVGTKAYFSARGVNGFEPWITDGSTSGTVKLFNNPSTVSAANTFAEANGFVAIKSGASVLTTDGTPAGTSATSFVGSAVGELVGAGDQVLFVGTTSAAGAELFRTDRTTASLVADLNPGTLASTPRNLLNVAGTVYFAAETPAAGLELWKSDGTDAGTSLLDLAADSASSAPGGFTAHEGWVYFRRFHQDLGYELWRTDGTVENTTLVLDLGPGKLSGLVDSPMLSIPGGPLLFVGSNFASGAELWQTLGTEDTTTLVADVAPGARSASPTWLTHVGGEVFFSAADETGDRELWATGVDRNPEAETPDAGTDAGSGAATDAGSGGGAADGGAHDEGPGVGPTGCGCGTSGGLAPLLALVVGVLLATRRRTLPQAH